MKALSFILCLMMFNVVIAAPFPTGTFTCETRYGDKDVFDISEVKLPLKGGKNLSQPFMQVTSDFEVYDNFKTQKRHEVLAGIASVLTDTNGDIELTVPGSNIYGRDRATHSLNIQFDKSGKPTDPNCK